MKSAEKEKEIYSRIKKIDKYAKELGIVIHKLRYCYNNEYTETIGALNIYPEVLEIDPNAKGLIEYL